MSLEKIKALGEMRKSMEEMFNKAVEENKADLENNRKMSIDKIVNYLYEMANSIDAPIEVLVEHKLDFYNGIKFRFNLSKDTYYPKEEKGNVLFSMYYSPRNDDSWRDIKRIDEHKKDITVLLKDWADIRRKLEEKVSETLIENMSNICNKTTDFYELCNKVNNFSV